MCLRKRKIHDINSVSNNICSFSERTFKKIMTVRNLSEYVYSLKMKQLYTPIMSKSWDNLIILDACRYDAFLKCCELDGELECHISPAKQSSEFMQYNFNQKSGIYNDTIYVTANKFWPLNRNSFFEFIDNDDVWDENMGTIPPAPVIERAQKAISNSPNKRLIVHLMQPHSPPINSDGQIIECAGWKPSTVEQDYNPSKPPFSDMLRAGTIDREVGWQAYLECLRYVLNEITPFINNLSGKTVITSDHGWMCGEKPFPILSTAKYGSAYAPQTMKIPWFIMPYKNRREIIFG